MFFANALHAQTTIPSDKIANYVAEEMQRHHLPNVAVGVVLGDSIRTQWDFGQPPLQGNYQIGSLSKSFTALAILRLVEHGKVVLDTPVRAYLPWFATSNSAVSAKIMVRHLLNQTGGIPTSAGFVEPNATTDAAADQIYADYLRTVTTEFAPGTAYVYSNMNYDLLGRIIAKTTQMTCGAYFRDSIFLPLDMTGTFGIYDPSVATTLIPPHQYWFGLTHEVAPAPFNDYFVSGSEIISNPSDMCRYLQLMMRQGKMLSGDSLLSAEHIRLMLTPYSGKSTGGYGMGWKLMPQTGTPFHTGLNKGYAAAMEFDPDSKIGVVVLTNINSLTGTPGYMADNILKMIQGKEPQLSPLDDIYRRYASFAVLFALTFLFLKNLYEWFGYRFKMALTSRKMPYVWLVLCIALAFALLICVPLISNVTLGYMFKSQPDYAFLLVAVATFSVLNAIIRPFVRSNDILEAAPDSESTPLIRE